MKLKTTALWILCLMTMSLMAQNYKTETDIVYTTKTDAYARERLKLDVYYPEGRKGCPVIVWFHGGGIESGAKEIPRRLRNKGYVVVGANYRLLPKVKSTIPSTMQPKQWLGCSEISNDMAAILPKWCSPDTQQADTSTCCFASTRHGWHATTSMPTA